jgi:hypothetical protein
MFRSVRDRATQGGLGHISRLRPFLSPLFTNVLEEEFSELRLYAVLGSSTVFVAFVTISATAVVGSRQGRRKRENYVH